MATRFYLTNTAAPFNTGTPLKLLMSRTPGSSLATTTTNTANLATTVTWTTIAGGANVEWYTPLLAAGGPNWTSITYNMWCSESNMSANAGLRSELVFQVADDGTGSATLHNAADLSAGVEFAVGPPRALENHVLAVTNGLNDPGNTGKRIGLRMALQGISMASGFTCSTSYNAGTAGVDGDAWIEFTSTLLDWVPPDNPGNPPRKQMHQLLAQ